MLFLAILKLRKTGKYQLNSAFDLAC